jgi:hypothetical protein
MSTQWELVATYQKPQQEVVRAKTKYVVKLNILALPTVSISALNKEKKRGSTVTLPGIFK